MAAVLCFLFLIQSFAIRVTLNEVARYEFNQSNGTQVLDATGTLGPLVFFNNVSWLAESVGIEIGMPGSLECANIDAIAPSLLNNFTLEFWMSFPPRAQGQDLFLVGLGNMTGRNPFNIVPAQTMALFQSVNAFYYSFPNQVLPVSDITLPPGIMHWVFTTSFRVASQLRPGPPVYLNGTIKPSTTGTPPNTYPFATGTPLQIAPTTQAGINWYGKLHHFSIYSRALTPSEILQNWQAGPADSAPYAADFNFTGPMDTVLNFSIYAYDLDFAFPEKNETQNCTIYTVPSLGTFLMGGVPVQAGTVVPRDQQFTYLGEVLGWGNKYANLTFSCIDSTGKRSGNATAWINLLHVDHPPTPNNLTINAVRANKTLIVLTGTNLDYYPMGIARITSLPTNGSLYLDTKPNSTLLLPNATFPINVTQVNSKGQPQLFYLSDTTSGANAGGQAVLFMDSFGFEISSKPNGSLPGQYLWGTYPGTVNISVTNNLFSQSTTITMPESTPNTSNHKALTLPGTNSLNLTYYAIIQSLPAHGKLYLPGSMTPLTQSDLPQVAGTNPATPTVLNLSIEYLPDFYYYGNDSFTFQLNETATGWLSAVATLSFTMTPVNQAPTIVFPADLNMTFMQDEQKYITILVYDIDNETSAPYDVEISSIVGSSSAVSLNISVVDKCANISASIAVTGRNISWACAMATLHNVSVTASFFDLEKTNDTGTLRVTVTDKSINSDPFSQQGQQEITYFVQKKDDSAIRKKIDQLQQYLMWGGIGVGIAAFCFCCCVACGRYQRHQVRKAMASNQYGGEATSLDRL